MKRQQRTIGAVITIPLPNGYRAYGRILKNAAFAFYDCISQDELAEVEQILQSNVLFIVAAFDSIIHQGRWLKIYKAPIEPILENLPKKYIEDALAPGHYSLYDANTGEITPATKQECQGLEEAAVWEGWHVEERLMKHFFPNSPSSH
jgi:hypothetical protein